MTKTTETNAFDTARKTMIAAGINMQDMLCTGKVQAVTILSAKTLANVILPQSLRIVNSQEDVTAAITRCATDEALVITTFDCLGRYIESKFNGTAFDAEDGQKFYDDYTAKNVILRRSTATAVLQRLDTLLDAETARCAPEGTDLAEFEGAFEKFIADTAGEPLVAVLEHFTPVVSFLVPLATTIEKATQAGKTVLEARDDNRVSGIIGHIMYDHMVESMTGVMLRETMKATLPSDLFDTVEAILESVDAEQH